jgi:hypothetical protein
MATPIKLADVMTFLGYFWMVLVLNLTQNTDYLQNFPGFLSLPRQISV